MMSPSHRSKAGFTLVELLVVVAIITLLGSVVALKLMGVKKDAAKTACREKLSAIYTQLQRFETNKRALPQASGSEFLIALWGKPFIEKSANNAEIFFCPAQPKPQGMTDDNVDDFITAAGIHYAGRKQEKPYKVGLLDVENSSKTIIVCDKPYVDGVAAHSGDCLCVLYASGATGQIEVSDFEGGQMAIGPDSPVEALHGLEGHPDDN